MKLRSESTLPLILVALVSFTDGVIFLLCKQNIYIAYMKKVDYSNYTKTGNAIVICDDGYIAKPRSTMYCLVDRWTKVECMAKDCLTIPSPADGGVTYSNDYSNDVTTYQAVASFFCNEGFTLVGNSTQTCLSTGNWSGLTPECDAIDCPRLQLRNGKVVYLNNSTKFKTVASVICNEGYYLEGNRTLMCTANDDWSEPIPTCTKKGTTEAPDIAVIVVPVTTFAAVALIIPVLVFFVVRLRRRIRNADPPLVAVFRQRDTEDPDALRSDIESQSVAEP